MAANHVIGVASVVGILSLDLFLFVHGGAKKFYNDMEKYFNIQNQLNPDPNKHYVLPEKDIVIENVRYLVQEVLGYKYIVQRNGKNRSCKIGRILSDSDLKFWDVWEQRFFTFKIDRKGRNIIFPSFVHAGPILLFINKK